MGSREPDHGSGLGRPLIAFELRNRFLGRLRLRWSEPSPELGSRAQQATKLYSLILNRLVAKELASRFGAVIDVGVCDWFYLGALARHFPSAHLLGLEVDGGRRYLNLHRRADLGRARARALSGAERAIEYRHGDFLRMNPESLPGAGPALFTFFFPFVSERPCVRWGLPRRFAEYPRLIEQVARISRETGRPASILSVHQGEWEAEIARKVYGAAGFPLIHVPLAPAEFRDFWPGGYPVECFLSA